MSNQITPSSFFPPSFPNSNKLSIMWFSPPTKPWYRPKYSETQRFPPLLPLSPPLPSSHPLPPSKALMESMWWRDEIAASSLSLKQCANFSFFLSLSVQALFPLVLCQKKKSMKAEFMTKTTINTVTIVYDTDVQYSLGGIRTQHVYSKALFMCLASQLHTPTPRTSQNHKQGKRRQRALLVGSLWQWGGYAGLWDQANLNSKYQQKSSETANLS